MPTDPHELGGRRLAVGLHPRTPEVEALVARRISELAAEVADVDLIAAIADAVEEGVPATEVATRATITYRQLDTWTRLGYLVPLDRPEGSGYPRRYASGEVLKARLMGALVGKLRMSPARASEVAEEILRTGSAEVAGFRVTRGSLS